MRLPLLGLVDKMDNQNAICGFGSDKKTLITITQTGWFYTGVPEDDSGGEIEVQKLYFLGFSKIEE